MQVPWPPYHMGLRCLDRSWSPNLETTLICKALHKINLWALGEVFSLWNGEGWSRTCHCRGLCFYAAASGGMDVSVYCKPLAALYGYDWSLGGAYRVTALYLCQESSNAW